METYTYVDSTNIVGFTPTVHIPKSAYIRAEWLLNQFVDDRANIELLRGFECIVPVGKYQLRITIDAMMISWEKVTAPDCEWYQPTDIHPIWYEYYLYDEDGEKLPNDFDIHVIFNKLTTH